MSFLDQQNKQKTALKGSVIPKFSAEFNSHQHINFVVTYAINAGVTTLTVSDSTATANSFDTYQVSVSDNHGNIAIGAIDPASPSTPVVISVTDLVPTDAWIIGAIVQDGRGSDSPAIWQSAQLELEGSKVSVSGTIEDNQGAGTLNIQVMGTEDGVETFARATVADTATASFGASALNSEVLAYIYLQNTSTEFPLSVYTVALTGDVVAGGQKGFVPFNIAPDAENAIWVVKIKTSVAALQTAVVTVTNNTTNASYFINITTTPA